MSDQVFSILKCIYLLSGIIEFIFQIVDNIFMKEYYVFFIWKGSLFCETKSVCKNDFSFCKLV